MISFLLASSDPLEHVQRHPLPIEGLGPVQLDNHIIMQFTATLFCLWITVSAFKAVRRARREDGIESMVPKGAGNAFEAICNYLRENVARPALAQHTDRFIPYIWSIFFFILFCNIFGLLPVDAVVRPILGLFTAHPPHIGGTATGNYAVTLTLSICTLLLMVINGLRLGGRHYLAHFCPGPILLAPLLVPIEIIGVIAKIFALSVRLCANMLAGHILLAVLVGFATAYYGTLNPYVSLPLIIAAGVVAMTLGHIKGWSTKKTALAVMAALAVALLIAGGFGVIVTSILGAVAITCLEIFVALLQAFIFTFLTCLFLGQSIVFHHDEHHEHAPEGVH